MSKVPPVPKDQYPLLTKPERLNIAVLQERRDYLAQKVGMDDASGTALSYHKSERDALNWVLTEVDYQHKVQYGVITKLHALLELAEKDPESTHSKADTLLLDFIPEEVREAYMLVLENAKWWTHA